LIKYSLLVVM